MPDPTPKERNGWPYKVVFQRRAPYDPPLFREPRIDHHWGIVVVDEPVVSMRPIPRDPTEDSDGDV